MKRAVAHSPNPGKSPFPRPRARGLPRYLAQVERPDIAGQRDRSAVVLKRLELTGQEGRPKFWKADASSMSAPSTSPSSPQPLRAPTPGAVTPSTASSRMSRQDRSSPTPDVEMEKLSLERKAFTEEPPSPRANAPSPELGKAARPISQSASPPLRSPAQVLRLQPQHQNRVHAHVSNSQSRKPKRVPHLITSLPSPRRHVSHPFDDKVYATSTQAHSAHPGLGGPSHPQPLSPAYCPRPAAPYEFARAHGLPMPGPMSASGVVSTPGTSFLSSGGAHCADIQSPVVRTS